MAGCTRQLILGPDGYALYLRLCSVREIMAVVGEGIAQQSPIQAIHERSVWNARFFFDDLLVWPGCCCGVKGLRAMPPIPRTSQRLRSPDARVRPELRRDHAASQMTRLSGSLVSLLPSTMSTYHGASPLTVARASCASPKGIATLTARLVILLAVKTSKLFHRP